MRTRCTNKNQKSFADYGAKGITVCPEWDDFWKFVEDMGIPPRKGDTVDRIDNSVGYCKSNCRWASRAEQARNTTKNVYVTVGDLTMTVGEWERHNGVRPYTYYQRIGKLGWDPVRAVTEPVQITNRPARAKR